LVVLGGPWSSRLIRPGQLSQSHAQILGTRLASDRCAACHPAASNSPLDWFRSAGRGHEGVTQSQLCLDCHHAAIPRRQAFAAHNLTEPQWQRIDRRPTATATSWRDALPRPEFATDQVACAACHREHHGAAANLSAITNAQCQTCHQNRFAGFADGHPDWEDWPRSAASRIVFDHRTHFAKHFADPRAADAARFRDDCRSCHPATATGEPLRTVSYAAGCASCHQATLAVEAQQGVTLLAVPSLPDPAQAGLSSWPAAASGFYDGRLGPLLRLLLRADREVADALDQLPPDGDLAKLDPDDPGQRRAAPQVAAAVAKLFAAISERGRPAVIDRLVGQGVPAEAAQRIGRQLSPQLVRDARQRWFAPQRSNEVQRQPAPPRPAGSAAPGSAGPDTLLLDASEASSGTDPLGPGPRAETPRDDDLLGTDPLQGDPLQAASSGDRPAASGAGPPSTTAGREPFDADATMPGGGWFQDETRLAIHYRASEHADPVLQSLLEIAASLPRHAPERQALLSLPATQACLQCHSVGSSGSGLAWTTPAAAGLAASFTRFSHRPHLSLASLADCQHCHQLATGDPAAAVPRALPVGSSPASSHDFGPHDFGPHDFGPHDTRPRDLRPRDFRPLGRATCVACHRPGGASDACTQCHQYHIRPPHEPPPQVAGRLADPGGR